MAFGKDMGQLGRIPAFGGTSIQQRTNFTQRNTQGPRSSRGRRFSDEYKPPIGSIDTGRLIAGNYVTRVPIEPNSEQLVEVALEYFPFVEHYDGRLKKSCVCSGGPLHNFKGKREPCRGCDLYYNPGAEKKRMSKRDMFAFNFLHMVPYHKTESVDQSTGQVRVNSQTNQPYFDWIPCKGRQCEYCQMGKEVVQGRVRPWPMGWSHFNALINLFGKNIARSCVGCGGRDTIMSLAWICPVDGCGEALIDMSNTTLNDKDIDKVCTNLTVCPNCKNKIFVREVFSCTSCQNPNRSTIFDVDIQLQRFESGKDGGNQTQLQVMGYSNPRPIDHLYTEIAKPLALDRMYEPTSIEVQEKIFEMQGSTPVQNQGFRPYNPQGQQPQQPPQQPQFQQPVPQGFGFQPPPAQLPQPQVQFAPQPQFQQPQPTGFAPPQQPGGWVPPGTQGPNYGR